MSDSAAELFAELENERGFAKLANSLRWLSTAVTSLCWAAFFSGLFMAIWSNMHHVDWGAACAALIIPGLLLGFPTLAAAVFLSWGVNESRADVRKAEVRYNAALIRENNL
jgi:hypothetical protein